MLKPGDTVRDPRPGVQPGREGEVIQVLTNPACLMRTVAVAWSDGESEEVEETLFGPLND